MAERIADNADLAVDELKRRARRRLVGAIVLALAAAVILPLLLEKDPKPLGDDVSVQIPPVDEGRFINRLTGRESKGTKSDTKALPRSAAPKVETPAPTPTPAPITAVPPASPVTESAPAPAPVTANAAPSNKSVTDAEQRVLSPGTKPTAKANAKTETKISAEASGDTKAPTTAETAVSVPPVAEVAAPPASSASKAEGFVVPVAALTHHNGGSELAGKLKRAGYG